MNYILYFDVAAAVLMFAIANHFFYSKTVKNQRLNIFGVLIATVSLSTVMDIALCILDGNMSIPIPALYILNALYLFSVSFVTYIFLVYVYILCHDNGKVYFSSYLKLAVFEITYLILLILTPFNHWLFTITDEHVYVHGPLSFIMYVNAVLHIVIGVIVAFTNKKKLSRWIRISLLFYPFLVIIAIVLQMYMPNVMMMQFAEAVSCQLIVFSIENPQDYKNRDLDIYNTKAFYEAFYYEAVRNHNFKILAFKISGMRSVTELMGIDAAKEALKVITDSLVSIVNRRHFYYLEDDTFCIMQELPEREWIKIRERIIDRFRRTFEVKRVPISFEVYMCVISYPDKAKDLNEALEMMSYALRESETLTHTPVVYAGMDILEKGHRETQIVQVLKNAVKDKSFDVYYQPIFNVQEGRPTRAEALVRLIDDEMGFINPEEFIPIAERNGLIVDIDSIVFNHVCEFIAKNKLWEKGIERIDINLSAVQCMQEDLSTRVVDVMDAHKLPYKMINLEITETAAIASEENLRRNMERLMEKGVNFSVDDYGTGFSNMSTIIDYPFTVVKIDKNMLWKAMKNRQAMTALKYTIDMLEDMGFEIITEGIEDKEMVELLKELHCYLHQGFYYSRPVPEQQFIEYIS